MCSACGASPSGALASSAARWRTPKRCCSSTTTRARSRNSTGSSISACVPDHELELAVGEPVEQLAPARGAGGAGQELHRQRARRAASRACGGAARRASRWAPSAPPGRRSRPRAAWRPARPPSCRSPPPPSAAAASAARERGRRRSPRWRAPGRRSARTAATSASGPRSRRARRAAALACPRAERGGAPPRRAGAGTAPRTPSRRRASCSSSSVSGKCTASSTAGRSANPSSTRSRAGSGSTTARARGRTSLISSRSSIRRDALGCRMNGHPPQRVYRSVPVAEQLVGLHPELVPLTQFAVDQEMRALGQLSRDPGLVEPHGDQRTGLVETLASTRF